MHARASLSGMAAAVVCSCRPALAEVVVATAARPANGRDSTAFEEVTYSSTARALNLLSPLVMEAIFDTSPESCNPPPSPQFLPANCPWTAASETADNSGTWPCVA